MEKKLCKGCNTPKPLDEFHVCRSRRDGRQTRCKVCKLKDNDAWQTDNKEALKAARDSHYARHPGYNTEYQRKYRKANPQAGRKASKKWRMANMDKVIAHVELRRARLAAAEGSFTAREWCDKKAEYNNLCAYCRKPAKLTAHHVVPLSKGGSNWISNIVPACQSCNSRIGTKEVWPTKE